MSRWPARGIALGAFIMSQVIACADQASGPVIGAAEVTVSTSGASLGLRIAFDSHRQGNTQIYSTDLNGSGQMPIT